jgi:hypothetical protein
VLHLFLDDRPWFAPKRFGYGAAAPIAGHLTANRTPASLLKGGFFPQSIKRTKGVLKFRDEP